MKKEAKLLRCTLLSGSAWSTERKYMRRYKGKCDIFFGIEHRLREEEMEEQFNEEAKEGWRFAANAARITDETTGSEDRKRTSGGVFVAVNSNLGAVVGAEEGAIESIPGNEGRINCPSVGESQRRIAYLHGVLLALRRMDSEECSLVGSSLEASKNNQTPVVNSV